MYLGFNAAIMLLIILYISFTFYLWKKYHNLYLDKINLVLNKLLPIIVIITLLGTFVLYELSWILISTMMSLILYIYFTNYLYDRFLNNLNTRLNILAYYCSLIAGGILFIQVAHSFFYGSEPMIIQVIIPALVALSIAFIPFITVKIIEIIANKKSRSFTHHLNQHPNKDMYEHYKKHGLDHKEIDYFRQQMATAKEQIETIEKNVQQTAKLRAIETRNNSIKVCQSFFKDIVNHPQKIGQANQFLYRFLPSLVDLTDKYNEINNHVAKNKQTYQILEKSAQTIDLVCQQITDEYIMFHKNEIDDLKDEVQLANLNLKRRSTKLSNDEVDSIIQNDLGGHNNEQ